METDSEKTKRGRPRKHDYEELDRIQEELGPQTRRGQQNHKYAHLAWSILTEVHEQGNHPWIAPLLERVRPSVLAELGRCVEFEDPTIFWQYAQYVAENDVSAKKAVAIIRHARLGEPPGVAAKVRLHKALIRTINDHLGRYPATTNQDIVEALIITQGAVEERPEN
jgi:hypothetical protein